MEGSSADWSLVTGTGGYLGSAIARELKGRGFRVMGVDRSNPLEPSVLDSSQVVELGIGPKFWAFDNIPGRLRHLVHAAGGASEGEVLSQKRTWENVCSVLQDNLVSAIEIIEVSKEALSPGGRVTLISSINAFGGYGLPVYSAAKSGLHGLTRAIEPELADLDIEIQCLVLGTVDHAGVRRLHARDQRHFERLGSQFPSGAPPTAEEMAVEVANNVVSRTPVHGEIRVVDFGQTE